MWHHSQLMATTTSCQHCPDRIVLLGKFWVHEYTRGNSVPWHLTRCQQPYDGVYGHDAKPMPDATLMEQR